MPDQNFPPYLKLKQLALAGSRLCGTLPLSGFERLKEHAAVDKATFSETNNLLLDVTLSFDEAGWLVINGSVIGELTLICQRCLEPMVSPVVLSLSLAKTVDEAEVARLPAEYEPILLDEESISAVDLIEDDLLLSLPLVPAHVDREACKIPQVPGVEFLQDGESAAEAGVSVLDEPKGAPENPFSVLEQLKKPRESSD